MLLIIFYVATIILFILGIYLILIRNDKIIGGISVTGAIIYLVLLILTLNSNLEIEQLNNETVNENNTTNNITTSNKNSTTADDKKKNVNSNSEKETIIGDTDSKIYHVPGDPDYDKEMKKTSNNKYFKTSAEAEAAGYRASKKAPK